MVFYQAALLAYPNNFMAANDLGVLLAQCGNYADARTMLEHSLALSPQSATWHNLAVVYGQLGQPALARQADQQAAMLQQAEMARRQTSLGTANNSVLWMDPQTFAQTSTNTPRLARRDSATAVTPSAVDPGHRRRPRLQEPRNRRQQPSGCLGDHGPTIDKRKSYGHETEPPIAKAFLRRRRPPRAGCLDGVSHCRRWRCWPRRLGLRLWIQVKKSLRWALPPRRGLAMPMHSRRASPQFPRRSDLKSSCAKRSVPPRPTTFAEWIAPTATVAGAVGRRCGRSTGRLTPRANTSAMRGLPTCPSTASASTTNST